MAISFVGSSEQGVVSGAAITLSLPTNQANDYVVVGLSVPRAVTLTVTTSDTGTPYDVLVPTVANGNLNFAVFGRLLPVAETQVRYAGSGNAQDGQTMVAMVYRGVDPGAPLSATSNSTTGTSTTPDSPAVTPASTTSAIVSIVGSLVADAAVTAPSSFLNQTDISASDTRSTTTGAAWVTASSTASFNPASWTNFTSAAWVAATVALRPPSTFPFMQFYNDFGAGSMINEARRVIATGYSDDY